MKTDHLLIALALGAALAMPQTALAAKVVLAATMAGSNETAGGDADGTGTFSAEIDADSGDFCYSLAATKIATATMAHVHTGATGVNGPPVVTIALGNDLCLAVDPAVLKAIVANPAGYYINVHNAEFPAGAVRGQLMAK